MKEGINIKATNALSRKPGDKLLSLVLKTADEGLLDMIKSSWESDTSLQKLISDIQSKPSSHPKFTWIRGERGRKGKLVIGAIPELKTTILQWLHDSPLGISDFI